MIENRIVSNKYLYLLVIDISVFIILIAGCGGGGSEGGEVAARHAPGSLDTSFGGDGMVTTSVGDPFNWGNTMAIQSDGKIVLAGASLMPSTDWSFVVVRYNPDGSLDISFGVNGAVTTPLGWANDIAIQSDGKIVVAGEIWNTDSDFAVVRYNIDGSLDPTFGINGIVTADIEEDDSAHALAIQSDGKIVVAGSALVRYNINGSFDTGFGINGIVTNADGVSIAIQTDGKIVTAGSIWNGNGIYDFTVTKWNTDGSLDITFGTGGTVTTSIGDFTDLAFDIAIQSDGKIVIAGHTWYGTDYDFAVSRYNPDGSLDASFGRGGIVTTRVGSQGGEAYSIAIQSNGKIVVAGSALTDSGRDFGVVRYNSDGSLDTSFGIGGIVITVVGVYRDFAYDIAMQSDEKIIVAGSGCHSRYDCDFAIARYWP